MSWPTKSKRNGNDEMPTDRAAVKIIRSSLNFDSPRSQRGNSPTKQPVTKVAKLVYETKCQPTAAVLKSIHSFRRPLEVSNSPERKRQKRTLNEIPAKDSKHSNIKSGLKTYSYVDSEQSKNLSNPCPETQDDLIRKRLEIQKDVDEIQKLLQSHSGNSLENIQREAIQDQMEISNIPIKDLQSSKNIPDVNTKKLSKPSPRRSKTDPNISGRGRSRSNSNTGVSNRLSTRSKSSVARSQQAESIAVSPKRRSYDPDKARQYMQEQKERRKAQAATEKNVSSKVQRDEIRKRLESLRKNTLAILQKNVKKARKKSENEQFSMINVDPAVSSNVDGHLHEGKQGLQSPQQSFILDQPSPAKKEEPLPRTSNSANVPNLAITQKKLTNQVKPLQASERNKNINQVQSNKKVGLLRKTEEDLSGHYESIDTPEMAIDKENVFFVPHTKPQSTKLTSPMLEVSAGPSMQQAAVALEKPFPELELNVPDVKLKPKPCPSVAEKSIQAEPPPPEKHALPYWLQPTPVQLYPYNFIKAVRKKLEAITNPVLTTKDQQTETNHKPISASVPTQKTLPTATLPLGAAARRRLLSRPNLNEVSSINMEQGSGHKLSSASSVFTPFLNSPAMSPNQKTIHQNLNQQPRTPPPTQDHSKSLSEITSSVTVNVPQSNTASDVSSLNSDGARQPSLSSPRISKRTDKASRKQDDDTTASSSVFSSPEKRLPKARMHLEKRNHSDTSNTFTINPNSNDAEKNVSPLSVDKINNLTLKSKSSTTSLVEVKSREDFEQMLQDFNKSLSHVIEVNQQLQTALSKSPRSSSKSAAESVRTHHSEKYSRSKSGSSSHKSSKYSSDFEETAVNHETSSEAAEVVSKNKNKLSPFGSKKSSSTSIQTITDHVTSLDSEQKTKIPDDTHSSPKSLKEASMSKPIAEETTNNGSNYTEEFVDSIENTSRTYMKIVMSPTQQQPLQDSNNFSKDSLEALKDDTKEETKLRESPYTKEDVIRNQINVIRGDGIDPSFRQLDILVSHCLKSNSSTMRMSDDSASHRPVLNSSMGNDIFAIFNQSEMELSIISQSSRPSETPLNYSTLGLYEQLIKTEATKTEHLTALLKIREKSILDRTRGQIALLEIQKEKCRAKGLTVQISIIKRKQRAILMKMEKEREEIRRVLKLSEKDSSHKRNSQSLRVPKIPELPTSIDISFRKNPNSRNEIETSRRIVRGYELDTSQNLETLLLSRELELKKRREHVERLLQWHQRLDKEEEEVLKIEEMLYKYNQQKESQHEMSWKSTMERKKEKKLMDINKSLRELQSISTNSGTETGTSKETNNDYVRTSGRKLNKLWCRLTGRKEIRFDQTRKYKLTKTDLEKIYEDAKIAVLTDFNENGPMCILTDQSKCHQSNDSLQMLDVPEASKQADIPQLNLNFSSGASEFEMPGTGEYVNDATFTRVERVAETIESAAGDSVQSSGNDVKSSQRNFTSSESSPVSRSYSEFDDSKVRSATTDNSGDKAIATQNSEVNELIQSGDSTLGTILNNVVDCSKEEMLTATVEKKVVDLEAMTNKSIADLSVMSLTYVTDSNCHDPISWVPSAPDEIFEQNKSVQTTLSNTVIAKACHDRLDDKNNESLSMIEDISAPKLESTGSTIVDEQISEDDSETQSSACNQADKCVDNQLSTNDSPVNEDERPPSVLEKRLIDLEQSLIELNNSFERVLSPDASSKTTVPNNTESTDVYEEKIVQTQDSSTTKVTVKDFLLNPEVTSSLMPDIINEVELRRRQQILVESDIIHLENAVPYALLREIPNKPPPPYVPPAHGSPMTTIFPSETRIKDITFRRTRELYEEINGNYNLQDQQTSILNENITNIYERIILDICKECVGDYQPTFTDTLVVVGNYKMPLALYNPPNRLKCVQEFVYKRVRKLLNMDKRQKRANSIFSLGRRKRDHVDEILIQELFEEEHKWTNFDLEEEEVKDNVIDEVFEEIVKELIDNFEESYEQKQKTVTENDRTKSTRNESFSDLNGD